MGELTLVQISPKFELVKVQGVNCTFFQLHCIFFVTNRQKTKAKGKPNESTAKQSTLRLYSSSEKAFAAAHLQKNTKIYNYNRP